MTTHFNIEKLKLMVEVPFVKGKHHILKAHVGNKKFTHSFSLKIIGRCTPNFSGANIAYLFNEITFLLIGREIT
jgi:ATP-dependent Zn protease